MGKKNTDLIAELETAADLSTLARNNADRMRRAAAALRDTDQRLVTERADHLVTHSKGAAFHARAITAEATVSDLATAIETIQVWRDQQSLPGIDGELDRALESVSWILAERAPRVPPRTV